VPLKQNNKQTNLFNSP